MKRNGLSSIIVSVLLILLVLIAIGIIWVFVKPLISQTEKTSSTQSCLLLQMNIARCQYSGDESDAYVSLVLNRGADSANVSTVQAVFTSSLTNTIIKKDWNQKSVGGAIPQAYGSAGAGFSLGAFLPASVAVSGVLQGGYICAPSSTFFCTKYQYTPGTSCADFNRDGFLTGDDYSLFVIAFENGDPEADYDGDTFLTVNDYNTFVAEFVNGNLGGC